jgi:hypothetical protein
VICDKKLYIYATLLNLLTPKTKAQLHMGIFSVKKEIGPDTMLQRKPGMLFNEIDGEVVMLSIENSKYYGMDKVGSRIWQLLENPMQFKELVARLMDEYDVTEEICGKETIDFLKKMTDKKLLDLD